MYVIILDVNDNPPEFPYTSKEYNVTEVSPVESQQVPSECGEGRETEGYLGDPIRESAETTAWLNQLLLYPQDTRVGTTVIPGTELAAKDADVHDTLYYTLQEVTPVSASPVPTLY